MKRKPWKDGRATGIIEGKAEGKAELIKEMFCDNVADNIIWRLAQRSGFTKEEVEQFRREAEIK
jgi:hypothetical protein